MPEGRMTGNHERQQPRQGGVGAGKAGGEAQ